MFVIAPHIFMYEFFMYEEAFLVGMCVFIFLLGAVVLYASNEEDETISDGLIETRKQATQTISQEKWVLAVKDSTTPKGLALLEVKRIKQTLSWLC